MDYDDDMEEGRRQEPTSSNVIQGAIRDFVTSIGESSKQLASAAEKFAGESLHILDDVARGAQESLRNSSDMASAASQAADEARRVAQTVHDAASQAGER